MQLIYPIGWETLLVPLVLDEVPFGFLWQLCRCLDFPFIFIIRWKIESGCAVGFLVPSAKVTTPHVQTDLWPPCVLTSTLSFHALRSVDDVAVGIGSNLILPNHVCLVGCFFSGKKEVQLHWFFFHRLARVPRLFQSMRFRAERSLSIKGPRLRSKIESTSLHDICTKERVNVPCERRHFASGKRKEKWLPRVLPIGRLVTTRHVDYDTVGCKGMKPTQH